MFSKYEWVAFRPLGKSGAQHKSRDEAVKGHTSFAFELISALRLKTFYVYCPLLMFWVVYDFSPGFGKKPMLYLVRALDTNDYN